MHTEDVLYYMKFIYLLELTAVKNSVSKPGNEFSDACIFRAFFFPHPLIYWLLHSYCINEQLGEVTALFPVDTESPSNIFEVPYQNRTGNLPYFLSYNNKMQCKK